MKAIISFKLNHSESINLTDLDSKLKDKEMKVDTIDSVSVSPLSDLSSLVVVGATLSKVTAKAAKSSK